MIKYYAMSETKYKIFRSIRDIEEEDWHSVFGNIPEGYGFYKTLEESGLEEFSFRYICIYHAGELAAIAPVFYGDLDLNIAIGGFFGRIIHCLRKFIPRFFVMKTLFCGSPFGENGVIGIQKEFLGIHDIILEKTLGAMHEICAQSRLPFIVFKDFLERDLDMLNSLTPKGFFKIESLPSVAMKLDFRTMEEYLKTLSSSKRKEFRRKLKKAAEGGIKVEVRDYIDDVIDDIYALYLKTYESGKTKFEKLTKKFFINITKNMHPHVKFFLYYVDGKIIAFNLCLAYKDLLIDKFIGFDYDMSYKYNLYFISWHCNVEWCLKESISYYQVGQTDYAPKLALGAKTFPLYIYAKHRNGSVNLMLKMLAVLLRL